MNIQELLSGTDHNKTVTRLLVRPSSFASPDTARLKKEYDPKQHKIFDEVHRPKREVRKSADEVRYLDPARIAFPFQKIIVSRAASFLFSTPVTLDYAKTEDQKRETVIKMLSRVLDTTKATNINKEIARRMFSETEVAEYWYPVPAENYWGDLSNAKFKLRCKIFSPFLGDTLIPHFDQYGDMVAFCRYYSVSEETDAGSTQMFEYMDCFTKDGTYRFKKVAEGWTRLKFKFVNQLGEEVELDMHPNPSGRIPVVYHYQGYTDWDDVQKLIERFEDTVSNFADTNDYFGKPILTVNGKIVSLPDKGESGKIVELEHDATASYLTWDQAPESVKLEMDTLENSIYSQSQTPNISFDKLQGIGNISGITLKMMFLDAHLKANDKIEILGTGLQRRFNIIKSYIGAMDQTLKDAAEQLEVLPVITPYMPSNEKELIDFLSTAVGGKAIMSRETAVKLAGQVSESDAEKEVKRIQSDEMASIAEPTM